MNRVTVDDNAFNDFLTKKSRLKFAEKREAKGKKPFLGIGKKQLANRDAGLPMPEESNIPAIDDIDMITEADIINAPAISDDYTMGGMSPVAEAGFFAKNKKALMIGGIVVLLGGVAFILKKKGII